MTQSRLHELFVYQDGAFLSRINRKNGVHVGDMISGFVNRRGYRVISVDNKNQYLHRCIFLYHYGFLPHALDHINRNKVDNRIENLRAATASENRRNTEKTRKNTSGFKGVFWHKRNHRYICRIKHMGTSFHLGYFDDPMSAAQVYDEKAREIHGEFACTNF